MALIIKNIRKKEQIKRAGPSSSFDELRKKLRPVPVVKKNEETSVNEVLFPPQRVLRRKIAEKPETKTSRYLKDMMATLDDQ